MLWQLVTCGLNALAMAKPLVVDLETNWVQSSYGAQVLESVAHYNSSAFYPLLSLILAHEETNGKMSDVELHEFALKSVQKSKFLSEQQVTLLEADLALGSYTASIESKFQTFHNELSDLIECENVLFYNGEATCDSGAVFALETNAVSTAPIFDDDRIIGGQLDAPWAILYGDISSPSFPVFHAHLLASALEGKINYVLRYKPTKNAPLQRLGGYGVTAQVKRTDYLVVDDRDREGQQLNLNVDAPNKLSKKDLPKLSFKLATHILKAKDRFSALCDNVLNLPSHISDIKNVKVSAKVKDDSDKNAQSFFAPGTDTLLINGALASPNKDYNVFQLMDVLREELGYVEELQSLGLDTKTARELISSGIVEEAPERILQDGQVKRYDYRSDAIIWINDLEKSKMYDRLPEDLSGFADPEAQLVPARRNSHNLVLVADFENISDLQLVAQMFQIVSRKAPVRVGIVPVDSGVRASNFVKIAKLGSFFARQKYLVGLLESLDSETAFTEALKYDQDAGTDPKPEDLAALIKEWRDRFSTDGAVLIVNGRIIPPSSDWMYDAMSTFVADDMGIRELIENGELTLEDTTTDLEAIILKGASPSRNDLIDPADPTSITYIPTGNLFTDTYRVFAEWTGTTDQSIWIVGDLLSAEGIDQLNAALALTEPSFNLRALPIIDGERVSDPLYRMHVNALLEQAARPATIAKMALTSFKEHVHNGGPKPSYLNNVTELVNEEQMQHLHRTFVTSPLSKYFSPNKVGIVIDGRLIYSDATLDSETLKLLLEREAPRVERLGKQVSSLGNRPLREQAISFATYAWYKPDSLRIVSRPWYGQERTITTGNADGKLEIVAILDPITETAQSIVSLLKFIEELGIASIKVFLSPENVSTKGEPKIPNRYYQGVYPSKPDFVNSEVKPPMAQFENLDDDVLYVIGIDEPAPWVVMTRACGYDLDNIILNTVKEDKLFATYELRSILIEGSAIDAVTRQAPRGAQITLGTASTPDLTDTMVMANLGYFQLQAQPGHWELSLKDGPSKEIYNMLYKGVVVDHIPIKLNNLQGTASSFMVSKKHGKETVDVAAGFAQQKKESSGFFGKLASMVNKPKETGADVNIFTVASGHLYERFLSIMTLSVMRHSSHTVKFWLIENFLSPSFKEFLPELAAQYNFDYEFITYKWPHWLRAQSEKQREIWGYKILFLDVIFPQNLENVMFVDSDQIVRTDLYDLVQEDLQGAPYGFTPMGDDREETEGFRFWKQGYWLDFLKGKPYHISALYVVDLNRFRELGAGDILRQHYQQLSADPASLANLDQDLPNNLQTIVPIHSLDKDWLWCETWCSDEGLDTAKTIDLCNNPLTKEPKLDRARRQIPEWTEYDDTVAKLRADFFAKKLAGAKSSNSPESTRQEQEEEEEEHYEL